MLTVDWTTRDLDADPLHLRPICDEDLEFILGLYQDWRVAQHLNRITVPFTHQDARELLDDALREAAGSVTATFVAHRDHEPVGLCLLHHGQDDQAARIGVIGYSVVPRHWGQGCATCMVQALVKHAINAGFLSLQSSLHVGNVASRRVLEKNGFLLSECGFMEELLHSPPREHAKYTLQL